MENRRKDDDRITEIRDLIKDDIKPQLTTIHDTIHGNGNKGLKTIVGEHGVYIKVLCGGVVLIVGWIAKGLLS